MAGVPGGITGMKCQKYFSATKEPGDLGLFVLSCAVRFAAADVQLLATFRDVNWRQ